MLGVDLWVWTNGEGAGWARYDARSNVTGPTAPGLCICIDQHRGQNLHCSPVIVNDE